MDRWTASWIRTGVFITLLVLVVFGWAEVSVLRHAGVREAARRTQCKYNLKLVHRAIVGYRSESGALPPDLDSLVRAHLLDHESLYCPSGLLLSSAEDARYSYSPENWGTEQPVVMEAHDNHLLWENALTRTFSLPLEPARFALYSDETVKNLFER